MVEDYPGHLSLALLEAQLESGEFAYQKRYQKYYLKVDLIQLVFDYFEVCSNVHIPPNFCRLERLTNIKRRSLNYYHSKWKVNRSYRPGQNFGLGRRLFTNEQEQQISELLRMQYINVGIAIRRRHLKSMLWEFYKSFDPEVREFMDERRLSYRFINDFTKRNKLSFRMIRSKKREEVDQSQVELFITEVNNIIEYLPLNRIFNMDETPVNFVFLHGKVLANVGDQVTAHLPNDFKQSFTAICTISLDCKLFPTIFLATGKTDLCHRQFDGIETRYPYKIMHSGGNTSTDVMFDYLELLHDWANKEPCALLIDQYRSHITSPVVAKASKLNIELIYVPKSGTDKYQPLDRRVFGAVKAKYAMKVADRIFENSTPISKPEAASCFIRAWNTVSLATLITAWRIPGSNLENFDQETLGAQADESDDENSSSDGEFEEDEEPYSDNEDDDDDYRQ